MNKIASAILILVLTSCTKKEDVEYKEVAVDNTIKENVRCLANVDSIEEIRNAYYEISRVKCYPARFDNLNRCYDSVLNKLNRGITAKCHHLTYNITVNPFRIHEGGLFEYPIGEDFHFADVLMKFPRTKGLSFWDLPNVKSKLEGRNIIEVSFPSNDDYGVISITYSDNENTFIECFVNEKILSEDRSVLSLC
ncbi:hypothetical protein ACSMXM_07135 [Pacificimonas sp. ICDLI1SI03]